MDIVLDMPQKMHEELLSLSKENMRSIEREVMYRITKGIDMIKHISDVDEGLLKVIASLYDRSMCQYVH